MIDSMSSAVQGLAGAQQQASLSALRTAAESQNRLADVLMKQAAQLAAANPSGVGGNVDTYA